jgi:two-component system cell cycle sensor histidine kinase/response regulator CckA
VTLARAFDPFFSTKADGRGTGLGLSIVRSIVERVGGFVRVESARGVGTTVRVYIPRISSEP